METIARRSGPPAAIVLLAAVLMGCAYEATSVGIIRSEHFDTCSSCREVHPTVNIEFKERVPGIRPMVGAFPNSKDRVSVFGGYEFHRPLVGQVEAVLNAGLYTGYDHLTGFPVSPLAFVGLEYRGVKLYAAPLKRGNDWRPFLAIAVRLRQW